MIRVSLAFVCFVFALAALAAEALPSREEQAVSRGSAIFNRYCVLCHGPKGDGQGTAAKAYKPPPANLVSSPYPDAYKELIIRKGGGAIGRSPFMPPWGDELSDQQIRDLIAYLQRIKARPA
jgi:mono/diheme cytochrome c family protein